MIYGFAEMSYVGRFAPSPSGRLHMGSLVSALASFLDARARGGKWLLRIEDIDPPREEEGAAEAIVASLRAHGLVWDGEVMDQRYNSGRYEKAIVRLQELGVLFACECTAKRFAQFGGRSCPCREQGLTYVLGQTAWRLWVKAPCEVVFMDECCGEQRQRVDVEVGDFALVRRDGLFAYQLAVVVDDAADGVTHVVRGADLLSVTARQIALQGVLGLRTPQYRHVPVVMDALGNKLSKQNKSPVLVDSTPLANLREAGGYLGLEVGARSVGAWLEQAVGAWAVISGERESQ